MSIHSILYNPTIDTAVTIPTSSHAIECRTAHMRATCTPRRVADCRRLHIPCAIMQPSNLQLITIGHRVFGMDSSLYATDMLIGGV